MESYIVTMIISIPVLIIIGFGWFLAESKITRLKESHKETIKILQEINTKLQRRIIELEPKHLKITLGKNN